MDALSVKAWQPETGTPAQRAAYLLSLRAVMCNGTRFFCVCDRHKAEPNGLASRYRQALEDNNEQLATDVAAEIRHQQTTLGHEQ